MPSIRVRDHEPIDIAIRRFKRLVEREGILTEMRKRTEFEKPSDRNKRAKAAAKKRYAKKQMKENPTIDPRGRRPLSSMLKKSKSRFKKRESA